MKLETKFYSWTYWPWTVTVVEVNLYICDFNSMFYFHFLSNMPSVHLVSKRKSVKTNSEIHLATRAAKVNAELNFIWKIIALFSPVKVVWISQIAQSTCVCRPLLVGERSVKKSKVKWTHFQFHLSLHVSFYWSKLSNYSKIYQTQMWVDNQWSFE